MKQEIIDFIHEHEEEMSRYELTRLVNATFGTTYYKSTITRYATNKRQSPVKLNTQDSEKRERMLNFIKDNSKNLTRKQLSDQIKEKFNVNVSKKTLSKLAIKLGDKRDRYFQPRHIEGEAYTRNEGKRKQAYIRADGEETRLDRYVLRQNGIVVDDNQVVVHINGEREDCSLDNLYVCDKDVFIRVISNSEWATRNELDVLTTIAKIKMATKTRQNKNKS